MVKKIFYCLFCVVYLVSCQQLSSDKKDGTDSLEYYPATPATISTEDFRYYYRTMQQFFDTGLLKSGFNGGILIAKNGAVIYEKYAGLFDIRKKDSITSNTAFHIASTSKTFTSFAILQMAEKGKLSLQDSLQKFFPGFPYPGITVQMLLNHRSGLPNYLYFMSNNKWGKDEKGKWNHQYATNYDVLKMMQDKKPDLTGPPDKGFSYCNTNYILLALIIEKISGMPYPVYLKKEFFEPLQMNNTYVFELKDTLTATPSFTAKGTYWNFDFLDATYGDKNIYTTPRDLLKWDQALYGGQLVSNATLDAAFKGYSFEKPGIQNYGLGWRLKLFPNGKKIVYHFGKWHGSNAIFARLINEKATIIILGNRFNRRIYDDAHLCYDLFGDYQQRKISTPEEEDSVNTKSTNAAELKAMKKSKN